MALLSVGTSPMLFTEFPSHTHDCYEVIINTQGEGIAQIAGQAYPFLPGTVHIIPPNTEHTKKAEKGFRDMYFHTDRLTPGGKGGMERFSEPQPLFLTDDATHTMEKLLSVLLERYLMKQEDEITETLYTLLLQIIAERCRALRPDPVISDVIHAITVSYSDPEFQVSDALDRTGYNRDYIRRRFYRYAGMTPNEYLKQVRIRHAKQLLEQKEKLCLPIQEVAWMCGYYDAAYFCRSFHKEVGLTPMQYAKAERI